MHRGSEKSLWDSFFCPVGGAALQALHWAGSKHLHLLSISQVSGRFSNPCVGTGGRRVREKCKKKSLLQISDVTLAFGVGGSWWSLKVIIHPKGFT